MILPKIQQYLLLLSVVLFTACGIKKETSFSKEALRDVLIDTSGKSIPLETVLASNTKQKKVLVVWASWCRDCLNDSEKLTALEKEFTDVEFLYLSLDRSLKDFKVAATKYHIGAQHYWLASGWEGPLGSFLQLSWIPRYLVLDEANEIIVFNATEASSQQIAESLKK
ncbi:conserved hypothetical protein [Tenacibaculum litopenaei]|uniref:TlpA family protein disulfide reductase n=1 Tax=Tenacibaculum litopenaei TaxID=396016 RepID=UPI003894C863